MDRINKLDRRYYLLNLIRFTISPCLDELKPSSLMIFKDNSKFKLKRDWKKYSTFIEDRLKINSYTLKETKNSIHIIFYKPKLLSHCLNSKECRTFLKRFGYNSFSNLEKCLEKLKDRYNYFCPHEIGVFLGYPVDDVLDFINPSNNKECLMKGYWKVYNDLDRAKMIFNLYDRSKLRVYNKIVK